MSKTCSTCGQTYPDEFLTCTCRFCGGIIEETTPELYSLSAALYQYELQWQEWQKLYNAATPRPLRENDWFLLCGHFNQCCICGGPIEEQLLVVPPYLGGKLYTYNVLPACEICAARVRQSQAFNPIKSLYTISGSNKTIVNVALRYLYAKMIGKEVDQFNFDEDTIELIVTCPEQTSIKPFTGIYAARQFKPVRRQVYRKSTIYISNTREEIDGITWRLLDESNIG